MLKYAIFTEIIENKLSICAILWEYRVSQNKIRKELPLDFVCCMGVLKFYLGFKFVCFVALSIYHFLNRSILLFYFDDIMIVHKRRKTGEGGRCCHVNIR